MQPTDEAARSYYACPGPMTDVGPFAQLVRDLPLDVPELCRVVQRLVIHVFWAQRQGLELSEERQAEVQIRAASAKFARILELDGAPLVRARPPDKKLVGNCRDYSLLLAAIFKAQGIPARARCGFGTYFIPDHYEDHWVVEYWNQDRRGWVMVDAQLDALQRQVLGIDFDPCDMPAGRFVTGGEAWLMCRAGKEDPDRFGIFEWKGMGFIRGDLLRDIAALNNVEMLPWDFWGLLNKEDAALTDDDLHLLDRVATLSTAGDAGFHELRTLYEHDERLRVPEGSY